MKTLLIEMYNDAIRELDKIKKGPLKISERVALERAYTKLQDLRKILGYVTVNPNQ